MEKRNYDKCKADMLTALKSLTSRCDDRICDDYGLWESLSADMLSDDETRLLAEHLDDCENCRRTCANAFAVGAYDGTPFSDRLSAFQEKPDSETDENWRKIAAAFDPSLANVEAAESVVEPSVAAPRLGDDVATDRAPRPNDSLNRKRETKINWRVLNYSAAAILIASVLTAAPRWVELARQANRPDAPSVPQDGSEEVEANAVENALSPPPDGAKGFLTNAGENASSAPEDGAKGLLAVAGENASSAPEDGAKGLLAVDGGNASSAPEDGAKGLLAVDGGNASSASQDVSKEGETTDGENGVAEAASQGTTSKDEEYVLYELELEDSEAASYRTAVAAFNDKKYKEAAAAFGELLAQLKKRKTVDEETLRRASWNLGVATMKKDDKPGAAKIFSELKNGGWDAETSAKVDAALRECEN